MSLEQSIDRLSGLIEQLIHQLELGRAGASAAAQTPTAEVKPPKPPKPSSSGTTKTPTDPAAESSAPSDSGESTGLDYEKDVLPFALKLARGPKRSELVALIKSYNPNATRLSEVDPKHYPDALQKIKSALDEEG